MGPANDYNDHKSVVHSSLVSSETRRIRALHGADTVLSLGFWNLEFMVSFLTELEFSCRYTHVSLRASAI